MLQMLVLIQKNNTAVIKFKDSFSAKEALESKEPAMDEPDIQILALISNNKFYNPENSCGENIGKINKHISQKAPIGSNLKFESEIIK